MRTNNLQSVFSDWISHGIFSSLNNYDVPWKNEGISQSLDFEYFGNISGSKTVSPLIGKLLNVDGSNVLSNSRVNQLAMVIYNMNIVNWQKEYATLNFEYNPISNYDMTETEIVSGNNSNTVTNTGTQGVTHTGTQGNTSTETLTGNDTNTGANNIYGFNSSDPVGDSTTSLNTIQSNTDNIQSTRTDNLTDTRTDNLTETGTGTHSDNRTLTRLGNIGVTTSQQMIESERELYLWNFFYKIVFPSVDKVLTIATYSKQHSYYFIDGSHGGGGASDLSEVIEKLDNINTKIDTNTNSINLSINQLRVSTFNAIDGATTRNY